VDASELAPVIAFLDAQAGYIAFYWTPPDGVQGLYRCATYTTTPAVANIRSLSAEFQQVFSA
jgi:phage-related protein